MLQDPCKTLGFKKNVVYKIPLGGGKPYPASCLIVEFPYIYTSYCKTMNIRGIKFGDFERLTFLKK